MNKNAIIGVLVAVIVIGGGYLLIKKNPASPSLPATYNSAVSGYQAPATTNTVPSVSNSGAVLTASTPEATTDSSSVTSISTAVLSGEVRPNGAATTYWFDYGTTPGFGARSVPQAIGSGYSLIDTPAYITGLQSNTLYYYRLNAENAYGTVNGATYTFVTNNNPPPQGGIPAVSTNAASNVERTTANLNGSVIVNAPSANYWFEYGTSTNLGGITSIQTLSGISGSAVVTASLTSLEPQTTYYFRLNAQNQYGTVLGGISSFTTLGPRSVAEPSVTTIGASDIANTSAQVSGSVDPNGAQTTYWFEYSRNSLFGTLLGSSTTQKMLAGGTSSVNVSANLSGLQKNVTYYYRIIAKNSAGTVYGSTLSFKTGQ